MSLLPLHYAEHPGIRNSQISPSQPSLGSTWGHKEGKGWIPEEKTQGNAGIHPNAASQHWDPAPKAHRVLRGEGAERGLCPWGQDSCWDAVATLTFHKVGITGGIKIPDTLRESWNQLPNGSIQWEHSTGLKQGLDLTPEGGSALPIEGTGLGGGHRSP